jgi:ribosome recycling factor
VENELMPAEVAEGLFIKPLKLLYNSLSKLLKDNEVVKEDSALEQKKIAKMVESIVKVQNQLVNQSKSSNISTLLHEMTEDIKGAIWAITEDTEKLINLCNSNFEIIDDNFRKLNKSIEKLELTIAKA